MTRTSGFGMSHHFAVDSGCSFTGDHAQDFCSLCVLMLRLALARYSGDVGLRRWIIPGFLGDSGLSLAVMGSWNSLRGHGVLRLRLLVLY